MKMPLKEIREHHKQDNNTCGTMDAKTFSIHKERGELLKLVDECKQALILLDSAYDETVIKKMISKLEGR
jgi:hypothetical protein